jgi:hypothetical protein
MDGPALRVPTGSGAPTRFFSRISVRTSRLHRPHISFYPADPDRRSSQATESTRSRLTNPQARPKISRESTPPQTGRRPKPKGWGVDSFCRRNAPSRPDPPNRSPATHRPACGQRHRQPISGIRISPTRSSGTLQTPPPPPPGAGSGRRNTARPLAGERGPRLPPWAPMRRQPPRVGAPARRLGKSPAPSPERAARRRTFSKYAACRSGGRSEKHPP